MYDYGKSRIIVNIVWLTSNPNADASTYCKVCQTGLRAHKADLEKHAKTTIHKNQTETCKIDKHRWPLSNFGISIANNSIKRKEIILVSYVATHITIRIIDHLTGIINSFNDNQQSMSSRSQQPQETLHLH